MNATIDSGRISGTASDDGTIVRFLGIPYAAPPVDELRWRAPLPPPAWNGVRTCDRFGFACAQPGMHRDLILPAMGDPPETGYSEDCLYLNVWSPADTHERRPVMVWFHGGGNRLGAGSTPMFDGTNLTRKGAVVVTVNYRLGGLGFLAHPLLTAESPQHTSGNYALLDAIAALQWVKRNIAAFGGDPGCVTLFGESAGAANISCLVASPLARGLFHRVIGESMGRFKSDRAMPSLAGAEQAGLEFAKRQGATSLYDLRNLASDQVNGGTARGEINLDGHVLPIDLDTCFAQGKQHDVPTLVGFNADEGSPYKHPATRDAFAHHAAEHYGPLAERFSRLYPAASDDDVELQAQRAMRDGHFAWQSWAWAKAQSRTGRSPVYMYFFSRTPAFPPGKRFRKLDLASKEGTYLEPATRYGAYHGAECVYVFNNLDTMDWPWTDADRTIADAMATYWVTFARTGNPNSGILPEWPAFDERDTRVLQFAETIGPAALVNREELAFFEEAYAQTSRT
jgi:para-nitrobenzyl esterase